jgi:hypothetical protein
VVQFRERQAVAKYRSNRFHMKIFNLKKLNESECRKKYCTEVSNMYAASEDVNNEVEVNSAWETIRENVKN